MKAAARAVARGPGARGMGGVAAGEGEREGGPMVSCAWGIWEDWAVCWEV